MTYYQEKFFFGISSFISSALFGMGAIMTSGESRWVFVTLAVSLFTSTFLALLCRAPGETIKVVVGRSGITVMLAIFGSRALVLHYALDAVEKDVLLLGGLTFAISIAAYFIGHSFVRSLDRSSNRISDRLLGWLLKLLTGGDEPKK